jgi:hypothetical protein
LLKIDSWRLARSSKNVQPSRSNELKFDRSVACAAALMIQTVRPTAPVTQTHFFDPQPQKDIRRRICGNDPITRYFPMAKSKEDIKPFTA